MRKILTAAAIAFAATVNATELPEGEFRNPSAANRPETYVFLIGGNVAKPGITADFEAIKDAGIAGILLFRRETRHHRRLRGDQGRRHRGHSPLPRTTGQSLAGRFAAD